MDLKIRNANVIADSMITQRNVYVHEGKILLITEKDLPAERCIDAEALYLSPGFIDLHVHGGGGADFADADEEAIRHAAYTHLKHGTTSLYPTLMSDHIPMLREQLECLRRARESCPTIRGAHLEGPYLSDSQCGAQAKGVLGPPDERQYSAILAEFSGFLRRWSYAPELDTDQRFAERLKICGAVAAAAHTDATFAQMQRAYLNGCRLVTHLYSCTSTIRRDKGFRILGVTEAALALEGLDVELIADGKHIPNELLRMVWKIKGSSHITLVTDAMRAAGTTEVETVLGRRHGGLKCIVEDGVAKLPDRSAFAGSVATTDRLLKNAVAAGILLIEAVQMLTQTPARIMGLTRKGVIGEGYDADLILFDNDLSIRKVLISGEPYWEE